MSKPGGHNCDECLRAWYTSLHRVNQLRASINYTTCIAVPEFINIKCLIRVLMTAERTLLTTYSLLGISDVALKVGQINPN